MKRIAALLLGLLLLFSAACAEESFTVATTMDGLCDVWVAASAFDVLPYLILHEDGTFEAYDWWMFDSGGTDHALMYVGSYTLDPKTGALTLEGVNMNYTLKTATASQTYESVIGDLRVFAGQPLLLLEAPPVDGFDESTVYIVEGDTMELLPMEYSLSIAKNGWHVIDGSQPDAKVDDLPVLLFTEEEVTYSENGESATVPYTMDHGRMKLTAADGSTHTYLLQYSYTDVESDGIEQLAVDESIELAQELGWDNVQTASTIRVTELVDGKLSDKVFYLISSEPLTFTGDDETDG